MLRSVSYLRKNMIVYASIIILLFAIFVTLYGNAQTNSIKQMTNSNMEQLCSRAAVQFETLINEMSDVSLSLATNREIIDILDTAGKRPMKDNYFNTFYEERRRIQMEIVGVSGTRFSGKNFNIISNALDMVTISLYENHDIPRDRIASISWLKDLNDNNHSKYIAAVSVDEYGRTNEETFSFVRVIQDEFYRYGYVDIQYEKSLLDEIFSLTVQDYPVETVILHGDDIFYTSEKNIAKTLNQDNRGIILSQKYPAFIEINTGEMQYTAYIQPLNQYGMKACFLLEKTQYMRPVHDMMGTIVILGCLILILVLVLVYFISYTLHKPIRQLRNDIEQMEYETLSEDFKSDSTNDEIILLTKGFNQMMERVRQTTDELIESRTREMKAKYSVLQAQIDPHFMHNILSVIGLMGYQKNAPEIMDICSELTNMMRYTTEMEQTTVTLHQEFTHAETYLKLMKYRYLETLQYEIITDEKINGVRIPKFVLQPLVENCFTHSLNRTAQEKYLIRLQGRITDKGWEIMIEDNGAGFDEAAAHKVKEQFRSIQDNIRTGTQMPDLKIGGLALINTYARLLLYLGEAFVLEVGNGELGGSCVRIIYEGGHMDDEVDHSRG